MERTPSKRQHHADTDTPMPHNDHDPDPDSGTPITDSDHHHFPDEAVDDRVETKEEDQKNEESEKTTDHFNVEGADEEGTDLSNVEKLDGENEVVVLVEEEEEEEKQETPTLETLLPEIDHFLSSLSLPVREEEKEVPPVEEEEKEGDTKEEEIEGETKEEEKEEDEEKREDEKVKVGEEEKVVSVDIPAFVEKFLDLFDEQVTKRDSSEGKGKWGQSTEEDTSFLEALDRVSKLAVSLDGLRSHPILGGLVNTVGSIQQRAMSYLEEEFRLLLEETLSDLDQKGKQPSPLQQQQQQQQDQPESEETAEVEDDLFFGYRDNAISNMAKIAKAMISGGYCLECCQVYTVVRRHAFGMSLTDTGFEKASIDEVQKMQWDALEREIPSWNIALRECAKSFISKEKRLADAVFEDYPQISSSLFSNLTLGVVIQLLNFAEAVAMTKRSAEKLFKVLDMYEMLRDSVPAMEGLLPEECAGELKTETFTTRCRIGEAAICIFCDLERSIRSDRGKTPVPGGAVHPLTRYTMNYLKYACEYMTTLEQVFKEHSKIERADSTSRPRFEGQAQSDTNYHQNGRNGDENQSPFSNQLIRVMDLLDSNLEARSKLYRDVSLSCIFMMNNGRYILQKIRGSQEIHDAMGDTWCRKKSTDLRNYHNGYKRETWSKLLGCLSHEGLQVNNKVVKPVLKERFKGFNALFDEIHRTQGSWVISDDQMQSELRVSISAVVIPAYRSFLGRFSQYLTHGRQYEKYIKYQPEDIETLIDELFDGNRPASMAGRRP